MKKITDPTFKYVPSFETDLRKKFRRIQAENAATQKAKAEQEAAAAAAQAARDAANAAEATNKTITLKERRKA